MTSTPRAAYRWMIFERCAGPRTSMEIGIVPRSVPSFRTEPRPRRSFSSMWRTRGALFQWDFGSETSLIFVCFQPWPASDRQGGWLLQHGRPSARTDWLPYHCVYHAVLFTLQGRQIVWQSMKWTSIENTLCETIFLYHTTLLLIWNDLWSHNTQVVWVTATAPYFILTILLARGVFLPGACKYFWNISWIRDPW